ncbi:hypothetical protein [Serratia fonticola]|uniref:hypothetical protein n=1 Tax=Serratia fonticola TaxID=47917 RepID=UPI000B2A5D3F|nr:hypothetical protein [Serratia fonticola]
MEGLLVNNLNSFEIGFFGTLKNNLQRGFSSFLFFLVRRLGVKVIAGCAGRRIHVCAVKVVISSLASLVSPVKYPLKGVSQ